MAAWLPIKTRSGERGSCRSIIMTRLVRIAGRLRGALKQGVRRGVGAAFSDERRFRFRYDIF